MQHLNGASHTVQYMETLKYAKMYLEMKRDLQLNPMEATVLSQSIGLTLPISLHQAAFVPVLQTQTNEQQKRKWLQPALDMNIIGCYAQTELSHGSNIRALQTTATFCPETSDFVLDTPNVGATKWWVGSLGRTATHAVVIARLRIPQKGSGAFEDKGPHPFIMQIRDMETLKPLPGITIGDIGPKLGYNSIDNGFMQFHQVHIPLDSIPGRTGHVSCDGVYTPPSKENSRAAYSSMTHIRVLLVADSAVTLARVMTAATRYLSIRRQFALEKNGPEVPVSEFELLLSQ